MHDEREEKEKGGGKTREKKETSKKREKNLVFFPVFCLVTFRLSKEAACGAPYPKEKAEGRAFAS